MFYRFNRINIGANVKYIKRKNGNGVWCYLERKKTSHHHGNRNNYIKDPVMVFVHGIGTNKDSWIPIWKKMAPHYHSIALDLPGNFSNFNLIYISFY